MQNKNKKKQKMSQQPNVLQYYQQWSDKTPFVSRSFTIGILVAYFISFFFEADTYLGNIPFYTVGSLEIYRMFLSPFVGNSILNVILILITFPTMASKLEWSIGSSAFLFLIGFISLTTNIIFDFICYFVYFCGNPTLLFLNSSGFWSVLFGLITIECMQV
jgi:hypothetical protein